MAYYDGHEFFRIDTPLGEEQHVDHGTGCLECGGSSPDWRKRLYIKRVHAGWLYYCHNCQWKGFRRMEGLSECSIRSLIKDKFQQDASGNACSYSKTIHLPTDCTSELPYRGAQWLLRYLDSSTILRHWQYSPSLGRIVVPCFSNDPSENGSRILVAWQGRYVGSSKDQPKWITNQLKPKREGYFGSEHKIAVVCEDTVSAIKVSRAGFCGITLLGSAYIPIDLSQFDRVFVWLDYDKKQDGLKFASRYATLNSIPVKAIFTKEDPKCYRLDQIKSLLGDS